MWEGLSVLESLLLKSFRKVQGNIFTIPLMLQRNIVLNVKLYLFVLCPETIVDIWAFSRIGKLSRLLLFLKQILTAISGLLFLFIFSATNSFCKIVLFFLPTPTSVLSSVKLRLLKDQMHFAYVKKYTNLLTLRNKFSYKAYQLCF